MLPMRWSRATPAPPEKALAWWFDLRDDDHAQPEHGRHAEKARRRVVERAADHVTTQDTWGSYTFPATVRLAGPRELRYEIGEGK